MEETASAQRDARVLTMREAGSSWIDIGRELGLTRQQARYAYQRARREQRRADRRSRRESDAL